MKFSRFKDWGVEIRQDGEVVGQCDLERAKKYRDELSSVIEDIETDIYEVEMIGQDNRHHCSPIEVTGDQNPYEKAYQHLKPKQIINIKKREGGE